MWHVIYSSYSGYIIVIVETKCYHWCKEAYELDTFSQRKEFSCQRTDPYNKMATWTQVSQ